MPSLRRKMSRLLRDGDGTTAIEYATLISLVLLGCISTAQVLTSSMQSAFGQPIQELQSAGVSKASAPKVSVSKGGTGGASGVRVKRSQGAVQRRPSR